jgi:hypothetical protein
MTFLLVPNNTDFVEGRSNTPYKDPYGESVKVFLILMSCGLFLILSLFVVIETKQEYDLYRLKQTKFEAQGVVIKKSEYMRNRYDVPKAYITYEYKDSISGALKSNKEFVQKEIYDGIKYGEILRIRYLPGEHMATISNQNIFDFGALLVFLFFFTLDFFLGYLSYLLIKDLRLDQDLEAGAQLIFGEVISCRGYMFKAPQFKVNLRYSFISPTGKEIKDKTSYYCLHIKEYDLPKSGEKVIAIAYLNDKSYRVL